jgi:hypothetical protein
MKLRVLSVASAVAALVVGCSGKVDEGTPDTQVQDPGTQPPVTTPQTAPPPPPAVPGLLRAQVENILNRSCGACHGKDGLEAAGMNYIEDLDQLIANGKVKPGDAAGSVLVKRIQDGTMPPPYAQGDVVFPTQDEVRQISEFIGALAPSSGGEAGPNLNLRPCVGQLVTYDQIYETIGGDLIDIDSDDLPFTRYLGLVDRYNASACTENLEPERWAMAKLLNSASNRGQIILPEAIDSEKLIYRIDIRDYGWDRNVNGANDGWEAIVQASPYAVPFEGNRANFARQVLETDVPYLSSNAFIAAASSGDVYYELADIDGNINGLFQNLRVDVQDDIERGRAARAGTTQSGISAQNRLVQRDEIAGGALWQSFEFGRDGGDSQMFTDPLGFNPGETEVIFTLPNGLHGYASFDENGDRLEESNILFDTLGSSDFRVRSAVSCMTCHSRGLLQVRDEVRDFVLSSPFDFNRDELDAVRELYPSAEDMDAIIESDRQGYEASLVQLGMPEQSADPVSSAFDRFNREVTLEDAAGELGVEPDFLRRQLVRLDPELRALGTAAVSREQFDEFFVDSLCILQVSSENSPDQGVCNFGN